jgi:hypothetical protein
MTNFLRRFSSGYESHDLTGFFKVETRKARMKLGCTAVTGYIDPNQ